MKRLLFPLLFVACRPAAPPPGDVRYPGILHPPNELSPDMVVEQHIEAKKNDKTGGFDAVLQKKGGDLTIVGLGPVGVRAFVLKQAGDDATFEQSFGPAFPFPPRNVLVDVHRAFFKRLPDPNGNGTTHGTLDDEDVSEIWKNGELVERDYRRADRPGAIRVFYTSGCTRDRCAPGAVRLVNEWFGYELTIENRQFHFL